MDKILELLVAILGSGAITTIIASLLSKRKYNAEIDQLKQQIDAARTDDRIKIDEHIQAQFMEIADVYKEQTNHFKEEIVELRKQNSSLIRQITDCQKQINDLNNDIDQLMSWVVYDALHYQKWLEKELLKAKPDVQFPEYRKLPKFVSERIAQYLETNNTSTDVDDILEHIDE